MWQWKRNVDTDNVFEQIFEKVKYLRKVFKYKYFLFLNYKYLKKYLNTFKYKCIWPPSDILHIWIGYSFEYAPPGFEVLLL